MAELSGSLEGIGLPALVRLLGDLERPGRLRVSQGGWRGEMSFDGGQLVAASLGATRGLAALEGFSMVLSGGEFRFSDDEPPAERDDDLTGEEPQQYLDRLPTEQAGLLGPIPSPTMVPRVIDEPDPAGQVVLDRGALATLLAVDGRRSVEALAAARGLVRALRELATLRDLGMIRIDPPAPEPVAARPPTDLPSSAASPRPRTPSGGVLARPMTRVPDRPSARPGQLSARGPAASGSRGGRWGVPGRLRTAEPPRTGRDAEQLRRGCPDSDPGKLAYLVNCLLDEFDGAAGAESIVLQDELDTVARERGRLSRPLAVCDNRLDVGAVEREHRIGRLTVAYFCALVHRIHERAQSVLGPARANEGYSHVYEALLSDQRGLERLHDLPRLLPSPNRVG